MIQQLFNSLVSSLLCSEMQRSAALFIPAVHIHDLQFKEFFNDFRVVVQRSDVQRSIAFVGCLHCIRLSRQQELYKFQIALFASSVQGSPAVDVLNVSVSSVI